MADAAVAVDFYETLDVQCNFTAKFTFNCVVVFDLVTELCDIVLGEILCAGVGIDAGLGKDILRALESDTVDIGKRNFNTLLSWNINTSYTSHSVFPPLC